MSPVRELAILAIVALAAWAAAGCTRQAEAGEPRASVFEPAGSKAEPPLAVYQLDLLELAFRSASAFPTLPHRKNRSRAQEAVVQACLELGHPERAAAYTEKIDDWRRGAGYADLAFFFAQRGDRGGAEEFLKLARADAEAAAEGDDEDSNSQDWRSDRIRSKIARAYLSLGQAEQAALFSRDLADSESGRVEAVRASLSPEGSFDAELENLETRIAAGSFDQVRNALSAGCSLFERCYADVERRARVEAMIDAACSKLPIGVRIDARCALIQAALGHDDPGRALELVVEAIGLLDAANATPEHEIPLRARLAGLRHRAGDPLQAQRDAQALVALYDARFHEIVDIDRAGVLRPLAEAYRAMGDSDTALKLYGRAIEAGVQNPNSRPRAEDLSATCCSMAVQGVEPDAALRARIRQILDGLGDPW